MEQNQSVMEQEDEVAGGVDVGRIVHICLGPGDLSYKQLVAGDPATRHDSFCRPALVVRVWGLEHGYQGAINAVMFIDGSNDAEAVRALGERSYVEHTHQVQHEAGETTSHVARAAQIVDVTLWRTSVAPGHAVKIPGTWHWPRLCKQIAWADRVESKNGIGGHLYHVHRAGLVDLGNCLACRHGAD